LKRNVTFLDVLSNAPKRQIEAMLNTATSDQITYICDCCNNLLRENVPMTPLTLYSIGLIFTDYFDSYTSLAVKNILLEKRIMHFSFLFACFWAIDLKV